MLKTVTAKALFRLTMTARALWSPTAMGVVGAVFDDRGRVLLVRHSYMPGWCLPGGGVDRGEPPAIAVRRELGEEVGLTGGIADFFALYSRRAGWATNVIALYRITGAVVDFTPNREIRAICFADPKAPPPGATPATLRRLAELTGAAPPAPHW